jgi:hypothetical protein
MVLMGFSWIAPKYSVKSIDYSNIIRIYKKTYIYRTPRISLGMLKKMQMQFSSHYFPDNLNILTLIRKQVVFYPFWYHV